MSAAHHRITRLATSPQSTEPSTGCTSTNPNFASWQLDLVRIPAPPFGESARAAWFFDRFQALGLTNTHTDDAGNVLAELSPEPIFHSELPTPYSLHPHLRPPRHRLPRRNRLQPAESRRRSPHPRSRHLRQRRRPLRPPRNRRRPPLRPHHATRPHPLLRQRRRRRRRRPPRHAPSLRARPLQPPHRRRHRPRGQRHHRRRHPSPRQPPLPRHHHRSRRPLLDRLPALPTPSSSSARPSPLSASLKLPATPPTTINVGHISGGTSINSIPESATALLDLRSTDPAQLISTATAIHQIFDESANQLCHA